MNKRMKITAKEKKKNTNARIKKQEYENKIHRYWNEMQQYQNEKHV